VKKVYITTPIYYPNAAPHLGSAYTTIIADFLARLYRALGREAFFLTGTDEHGEKLERKAEELGKTSRELVDEMSRLYKDAWVRLGIRFDRFIRTTEKEHEETVRELLKKIHGKGDIYRGTYNGLYCVGCERYYTEAELVDGKCPYHDAPLEEKDIEAYFFKLAGYRDKLLNFYEKNPQFLPEGREKEIINRVGELEDLCISRPKEQLQWGIELPFDAGHVAYVWVDALLNYVSGAGYGTSKFREVWPPDIQLMAKDITWFHCVIWPALLMSAGLELPRRVVAHGFINVDGRKMSKSLGNMVDPLELADRYGPDLVRFLLVTKLPFREDSNLVREQIPEVHKELAGSVGNLANRVLKLLSGVDVGSFKPDTKLKGSCDGLLGKIRKKAGGFDVTGISALYSQEVPELAHTINSYINETEPWKLEGAAKRDAVLNAYEGLLFLMAFLSPVLVNGWEKFRGVVDAPGMGGLKGFGQNSPGLEPSSSKLIMYER
jgi:methionyl-tRNA synthetase